MTSHSVTSKIIQVEEVQLENVQHLMRRAEDHQAPRYPLDFNCKEFFSKIVLSVLFGKEVGVMSELQLLLLVMSPNLYPKSSPQVF